MRSGDYPAHDLGGIHYMWGVVFYGNNQDYFFRAVDDVNLAFRPAKSTRDLSP